MTTRSPVSPQHLRAHASTLDVLRSLLEDVQLTSGRIGDGQEAYGLLCGWVLTGLGDRYLHHRDQLTYIEESLAVAVQALHRAAGGRQSLGEWLGITANGIATTEAPVAYDRPQSLSHVMDDALEWVSRREWVEPQLAEAAPVAEFAAPVDDSYAVLRVAGLACAVACVEPVRGLLDDLGGAPDVVAEQVACWNQMAADLHTVAADLRLTLDEDFGRYDRIDVRAYLDLMSNNVEALKGLAAISAAMAVITKAAGDLILLVRDIVRGLIADLVARVIIWVSDAPAVVPLPVMAARLATAVATSWRIHAYLTALTISVANLSACING